MRKKELPMPRTRVSFITALLLASLSILPLLAQEEFDVETVSIDSGRMIKYLDAEGEKVSREAWERISTRQKLENARNDIHREFLFMIGLDPLPPRTPLEMTQVRTVDRQEYTIDVLHYQSLPGFYVTANLYKPKNGSGPFPAVVWGPGHSIDDSGAKALRQNYAIPWVRAGYICMVIDPIQAAEVFGVHGGTSTWNLYDWYSRGYSPIGIEVWNAMRAVDYLQTRSDVDGTKLTINGVSGGGHLSWMAGAADPRFTVVQPVAGTSDIATHVSHDLQNDHCDCAYFINTYRHDWPTLAALIAPRPLLMHNSTEDLYYPQVGYRNVLERAEEIYSWYGAEEKTAMFEVPGGHGYTQPEREKAVEWCDRWLKGKDSKVTERPFERVPDEELAALGGQLGDHPRNINDRIQELLIPEAKIEAYASQAEWETRRAEVMENLRSVVLRNMPADINRVQKVTGEHGRYAIETEPGILIGMVRHVPESMGPKQNALLVIASEGDTEAEALWAFTRAYPFEGYAASRHLVFPRGLGSANWDAKLMKRFRRSAMLLGRTLDEMRLYDVLCAVDQVASDPSFNGRELTVAGRGVSGLLGAYAALLDPRITRVILHSPPLTHKEGPVFLNILRYTDIPQALAMLAPRELVFLTHDIEHFRYTRDVYSLYGAEKRFRKCVTVPQALNLQGQSWP
jgi:cephalosporin-C deacetylase-like acetyl esterase